MAEAVSSTTGLFKVGADIWANVCKHQMIKLYIVIHSASCNHKQLIKSMAPCHSISMFSPQFIELKYGENRWCWMPMDIARPRHSSIKHRPVAKSQYLITRNLLNDNGFFKLMGHNHHPHHPHHPHPWWIMGPLYARLLQGPISAATQSSLLKPVGAKAGHRLPALFKLTKSGRNSRAVLQVSIQIYPNYEHSYSKSLQIPHELQRFD